MTILIADNQPVTLMGLRSILTDAGQHVQVATTLDDALLLIHTAPTPTLVIAGFFLVDHGKTTFELLQTLRIQWPDLPVMLRFPSNDPHLRIGLPQLGVRALIPTDADPDLLNEAVGTVLDGGTWFTAVPPDTPVFTPRDLAILQSLRNGAGHKNANDPNTGSRTSIDNRLAKIRPRFGARSTTELVTMVVERGLAYLPPESLEEWTGGREDGRTGPTMLMSIRSRKTRRRQRRVEARAVVRKHFATGRSPRGGG